MAVGTQAQPVTPYVRRARSVWILLAISTVLFCSICSATGIGAYSYLNNVTLSEHATLQLVHGSQLTILRSRRLEPEAVTHATNLNEGDEVRSGDETEANLDLFDGSTVHVFFNSSLVLATMRTSRFFGNLKEIVVNAESGTLVLSTADQDGYSSASYRIITPKAEIQAEPNSTVRVQLRDAGNLPQMQVVVTAGSAVVLSGGKRVEVQPGNMANVTGDNGPIESLPAEQELIRNGNFTEPPTSGAELAENGGLDTAAWLPITEQSAGSPAGIGSVGIETENIRGPGLRAAVMKRNEEDTHYAKMGIRQEINTPASFLRSIELRATVKVVEQTEPVGGPQGDVFPLTVNVIYTDPNGKQHIWQQSFYFVSKSTPRQDSANTTEVNQGAWYTTPPQAETNPPLKFVLKQLDANSNIGQDISVINAIEIYGIGTTFQSWITDISMIAR